MQWLINLACILASSSVVKSCTDIQLNKAQMGFRDCMEEKKGVLLTMEPEEVGDVQDAICNGLKDMSEGCQEAVQAFAKCNGREQVDHLVAIHINAFTEILSAYHREVDIRSCPVFHTPPPTIVHTHQPDEPESLEPEPEYVTGGTGGSNTLMVGGIILSILAIHAL